MPEFTQDEIESLKGSSDFLGINYYTSVYVVEGINDTVTLPSYLGDRKAITKVDFNWPVGKSYWLRSVPAGFKELLL